MGRWLVKLSLAISITNICYHFIVLNDIPIAKNRHCEPSLYYFYFMMIKELGLGNGIYWNDTFGNSVALFVRGH